MKRIILFFLFFCTIVIQGYGQENPFDTTGNYTFDSLGYYQHLTTSNVTPSNDTPLGPVNFGYNLLDINRIPYGALVNKSMNLSDLLNFVNSSQQNPVSNPLHFHQAYFEYYGSLFNPLAAISPDTIIHNIDTNNGNRYHPFVLLKANVSSIKADAISSGAIRC